uniref:Putative secreted protein n=1 Tax=Anopheles marajoara TaxID=58244 RepID=A0A2M4C6Z9_9DIPT
MVARGSGAVISFAIGVLQCVSVRGSGTARCRSSLGGLEVLGGSRLPGDLANISVKESSPSESDSSDAVSLSLSPNRDGDFTRFALASDEEEEEVITTTSVVAAGFWAFGILCSTPLAAEELEHAGCWNLSIGKQYRSSSTSVTGW